MMLNLPGYQIEERIGSGGMATVYLAMQEFTKRKVAIKVMSGMLSADPTFSQRFLKEASCAHLAHPNIITVHDAGMVDNHNYIVMEYASGGDLAQALQKGLSVHDSISIIKQIASALGYAHDLGYVHRDVKPANIMFRADGTPILMDFGIAKASSGNTQLTNVGMAIGSPHYMSPEQARGRPLDGRSDIYSLGITFYEMLTGTKPYDAEDTYAIGYMHINDDIPRLPAELGYLQGIINTMLAKHPDDRYTNSNALIDALNVIQPDPHARTAGSVTGDTQRISTTGDLPTRAMPTGDYQTTRIMPSSEQQAVKHKSSRLLLILAAVIFITAGLAGVYVYLPSDATDKQAQKTADQQAPQLAESRAAELKAKKQQQEIAAKAAQQRRELAQKHLLEQSTLEQKEAERKLAEVQKQLQQEREQAGQKLAAEKERLQQERDQLRQQQQLLRQQQQQREAQKKAEQKRVEQLRAEQKRIEELRAEQKRVEEQRAEQQRQRDLQAARAETAAVTRPKTLLAMSARNKIVVVSRFQKSGELNNEKSIQKTRKLAMAMLEKIKLYSPAGVKFVIIEEESISDEMMREGAANNVSLQQCRKYSADYLVSGLMQDPEDVLQRAAGFIINELTQKEDSGKQRKVDLKLLNCATSQFKTGFVTTTSGTRVQSVVENLDTLLQQYTSEPQRQATTPVSNQDAAPVAKPDDGKPRLPMSGHNKIVIAARFQVGGILNFDSSEDKTHKLALSVQERVRLFAPDGTGFALVEDETLTYNMQYEGDSSRHSQKQCRKHSAAFVISALLDDPDESVHREVLVKLFDCTSKAFRTDVFSTRPDKRVKAINKSLKAMILDYIENP